MRNEERGGNTRGGCYLPEREGRVGTISGEGVFCRNGERGAISGAVVFCRNGERGITIGGWRFFAGMGRGGQYQGMAFLPELREVREQRRLMSSGGSAQILRLCPVCPCAENPSGRNFGDTLENPRKRW